jgi:hypothetical protein
MRLLSFVCLISLAIAVPTIVQKPDQIAYLHLNPPSPVWSLNTKRRGAALALAQKTRRQVVLLCLAMSGESFSATLSAHNFRYLHLV